MCGRSQTSVAHKLIWLRDKNIKTKTTKHEIMIIVHQCQTGENWDEITTQSKKVNNFSLEI